MPTTLQFDNISVKTTTMKGLGYHGPGYKAWQDVPMPSIQQDTDAIVRVDATTICGTSSDKKLSARSNRSVMA
jgi:threonine dehydrogenase-like Zn-dependent dehydrogenase